MCCTFSFDLIIKLPFNILMFVSLFLHLVLVLLMQLQPIILFMCVSPFFLMLFIWHLGVCFSLNFYVFCIFCFALLIFATFCWTFVISFFIFCLSILDFIFYFEKYLFSFHDFVLHLCFALDWNLAFFLFMGKSFLVYFRKHLRYKYFLAIK